MTGRPAILTSLTLLALALAPLLPGMGGATTLPFVGSVPDVVAGERVLEDGVFDLTTPLLVPAGATLTIRNAVVLLNTPSQCNIEVQGLIGCRGTIQLAGGVLVVRDSVIDTTLHLGANPSRPTISGHAGVIDIQGSTINNISRVFMQQPGIATNIFRDNLVKGSTSGIVLWRGADGIVENNRFEDLSGSGVIMQDATGVIRGNTFVNVQSRVIDVQMSQVGEKVYTTSPLVEGNTIQGGWVGITYHTGFGGIVRDNVIRDTSGSGLALGIPYGPHIVRSAGPEVTGNLIENTRVAVTAYGAISDASGRMPLVKDLSMTLRGNSFLNSACMDIDAIAPRASTLTVDATGNWWGSADGPQDRGTGCPAVATSGAATVATAPWLTAAPS